ncbi:MAG: DUF3857 domain-containing protein [Desulfobacteraceae bacterium]|nr:DUF3857 domain-containing protein [Desulfobacteraceae bacterium]
MKKNIPGRFARTVMVWLLFLISAAGHTMGADTPHVDKTPAPQWVHRYEIVPATRIPLEEIQDGEYFLHVDRQIRVTTGDPVAYFYRFAVLIVNETGLERASQISITFNPDYQQLALHSLNIVRDGTAISRLDETSPQLLRREERMDSLIYDGRYTTNLIVQDVRVGDILEYAYTISGDNPIYDNIFSYQIRTSWSVPVKQFDFRLHWPRDRQLHEKRLNTTLNLHSDTEGDYLTYGLSQWDVNAVYRHSQTPSWYRTYGVIQLSETRQWSDVVQWALPLYAVAYESQPVIDRIAGSLVTPGMSNKQKVLAALNYIQKEIRYLGIEIGVNSHKPRAPEDTVEKRYGDCKDKSVAVVSLLKSMGISAHPVLVHTYDTRNIKDLHPTINAFNHVIVRVDVDGEHYWLDPTRVYQGADLDHMFQPDYGYALVIAPGENDLTPMPDNAHLAKTKVEETFDLSDGPGHPAYYTIISRYNGLDAEDRRSQIAEDGAQQIQNSYMDFYRKYYPKLEARMPMEINDRIDANELWTIEKYIVEDFWQADERASEWTASFYTNIIDSYLSKPSQRQRSEPFRLSHPVNVHQRIDVRLPEPWNISEFDASVKNTHFAFSAKVAYDPDATSFFMDYHYQSLAEAVLPEELDDYMKSVDNASEHLDYELYTPFEGVPAGVEDDEKPNWFAENADILLIVVLVVLGLYAIVEWLVDTKRPGFPEPGDFYPVSTGKYVILSIATMGIYSLYWFYRQWKYIKQRDDSPMLPFWRAFFLPFWFYSLFREMRADSEKRMGKSILPDGVWMVLLLIVYIATNLMDRLDGIFVFISTLNLLCLLPFLNYTQYINRTRQEFISFNSRFRPRHYLLSVFAGLILAYSLSTTLNWMPSGEVVKGAQLPEWNIKFMQRNGLVQNEKELLYFYSDAFWSYKDDGNGITDSKIFSYWRDEITGGLNVRTAEYKDISDIEVDYGAEEGDTTVITVQHRTESDFYLYAAAGSGMDRRIVQEIRNRMGIRQVQR